MWSGLNQMKFFLKFIWLLLSVLVLVLSLYFFEVKQSQDSEIFLIYAMLVLSFPLGLLASLILSLYSFLNGAIAGISILVLVLEWLMFLLFGWIQWFVLIPKAIHFVKKFRKESRGG